MKSILVAADGSEYSKKAIMKAKRLAETMASKVTIINVSGNLPAYVQGTYVKSIKDSIRKHQDEILEEALKIFQESSIEVDILRRKGDAGDSIIKEAEEGDYDLIIMGARGEGVFSRTILGSISNKVLKYASKDVLISK